MPRAVQTAYDDPEYTDPVRGGPLRLLSEQTANCRELWQQLVGYSKETEPLAVLAAAQRPRYVKLNEHLQDHHAALLLANSPGEELVKGAKNTSAQQAAHPTGAEVKLKNYFSTVWEPDMWGAPTPEWLADTRRERRETATAAAKARKEQRAAPPLEPLPLVQLVDGLDDAETSGDENEDLLAEVTGSSEDGRSNDSDVEEDDDDDDGDQPIPRNELVRDMVCWCWDADLNKAPYTSKQAPKPNKLSLCLDLTLALTLTLTPNPNPNPSPNPDPNHHVTGKLPRGTPRGRQRPCAEDQVHVPHG